MKLAHFFEQSRRFGSDQKAVAMGLPEESLGDHVIQKHQETIEKTMGIQKTDRLAVKA